MHDRHEPDPGLVAQPAPEGPSLPAIAAAAAALGGLVRRTPIWELDSAAVGRAVPGARVVLKLECFQHTGSFKVRGALAVMQALDGEALRRGVTAVSAGNHAAAVAYAARALGTTAKVVMPRTANALRVQRCRELGAEVVLAADVREAFETTRRIEAEEGRTFVHPFEGPRTALGTATLGLEFLRQAPDLEAVIVPIGGGGLAAGVASAVRAAAPRCAVWGVEPEGADTMTRSFAAGGPTAAGPINTIADSLAPPFTLPYSYGLCRRHLEGIVLVDDDALCRALYLLFRDAKLAVEPAGAASTAALVGPLRERLVGRRVGLIVCGSNIDPATYARYLAHGAELEAR